MHKGWEDIERLKGILEVEQEPYYRKYVMGHFEEDNTMTINELDEKLRELSKRFDELHIEIRGDVKYPIRKHIADIASRYGSMIASTPRYGIELEAECSVTVHGQIGGETFRQAISYKIPVPKPKKLTVEQIEGLLGYKVEITSEGN